MRAGATARDRLLHQLLALGGLPLKRRRATLSCRQLRLSSSRRRGGRASATRETSCLNEILKQGPGRPTTGRRPKAKGMLVVEA